MSPVQDVLSTHVHDRFHTLEPETLSHDTRDGAIATAAPFRFKFHYNITHIRSFYNLPTKPECLHIPFRTNGGRRDGRPPLFLPPSKTPPPPPQIPPVKKSPG
jgi:hypothetical protein